jgi:beta-lactamase class D
MDYLRFSRLIPYLLFLFPCFSLFAVEENFLLLNARTNEIIELGPHVDERITTCSTFKIVLSLMGYDSGILIDENTPIWDFQEGYDDFLELWKTQQTPKSWMKCSCVWYSKLIAAQLGLEKIQAYLALLDYGNQDMSGGLLNAWRSSSLKVSPKEQVNFIHKMLRGNLLVSSNAIKTTKKLLFLEELSDGWSLFGKTGWGSIRDENDKKLEVAWFVGWVEKDQIFFPFAYNIQDEKINLAQRIPRVKQLLVESNVMNSILLE